MTIAKPKSCPFCGSHDVEAGSLKAFIPKRYFIHCNKCQTSGPLSGEYEDEEAGVYDAVKKWNKRSSKT